MKTILSKIVGILALFGLFTTSACGSLSLVRAPEPVTLKFRFQDYQADYESLAKQFNQKYPYITIEILPITQRFNRSIQDDLADIDVVRARVSYLNQEISDQLLEIDTFLQDDNTFPRTDYLPGTLEGLTYEGKQVGLPAGIAPYVVFYEPEKFEAAGITLPTVEQGWRLDEFMAAAIAINQPVAAQEFGKVNYGFCSTPEGSDPILLAYQFGGGLVDDLNDPTMPTLNTIENATALRWYADLKDVYEVLPPERDYGSIFQYASTSQCGFWMNWLDSGGFKLETEKPVAVLPLPTAGGDFTLADMDAYFIPEASQHPQEAWLWIRYLADQESASGAQIPPRRSQIDSYDYEGRAQPSTLALARSLPETMVVLGMGIYRHPAFEGLIQLYIGALNEVMDNFEDPLLVLEQAQSRAEPLFILPTPTPKP
jgi:ABC-type glycerol-3-phosphate transport system substrate-binding protein